MTDARELELRFESTLARSTNRLQAFSEKLTIAQMRLLEMGDDKMVEDVSETFQDLVMAWMDYISITVTMLRWKGDH